MRVDQTLFTYSIDRSTVKKENIKKRIDGNETKDRSTVRFANIQSDDL